MMFLLTLVVMSAVFTYGYSCGVRDLDRQQVRLSREARRKRFANERGLPSA